MTDDKTLMDKATDATLNAAGKAKGGVAAVWDAVKENPGHAVVGAVVGQILIPIPGVGAAIGGGIGGWIGKKRR